METRLPSTPDDQTHAPLDDAFCYQNAQFDDAEHAGDRDEDHHLINVPDFEDGLAVSQFVEYPISSIVPSTDLSLTHESSHCAIPTSQYQHESKTQYLPIRNQYESKYGEYSQSHKHQEHESSNCQYPLIYKQQKSSSSLNPLRCTQQDSSDSQDSTCQNKYQLAHSRYSPCHKQYESSRQYLRETKDNRFETNSSQDKAIQKPCSARSGDNHMANYNEYRDFAALKHTDPGLGPSVCHFGDSTTIEFVNERARFDDERQTHDPRASSEFTGMRNDYFDTSTAYYVWENKNTSNSNFSWSSDEESPKNDDEEEDEGMREGDEAEEYEDEDNEYMFKSRDIFLPAEAALSENRTEGSGDKSTLLVKEVKGGLNKDIHSGSEGNRRKDTAWKRFGSGYNRNQNKLRDQLRKSGHRVDITSTETGDNGRSRKPSSVKLLRSFDANANNSISGSRSSFPSTQQSDKKLEDDDSISNTPQSSVQSNSLTGSSTGSSSSSSKSKKKRKKRRGWFEKMMKSSHDEHRLIKVVLWFPIGVGVAFLLYFLTIRKLRMAQTAKHLIGAVFGLVLSLSFALSVQMRCVLCLVVPTFVGKAGRSYIAAFALIYLIEGPITNIMVNSKDVVRSLTCTSELLSNHSKEKWKLRLHPIEGAFGDIQKDGFLLERVAKRIEKAFKPLTKEVMDHMAESKMLKKEIKRAEKSQNSNDNTVQKIERAHRKDKEDDNLGRRVEQEWEKKLDLRCQETFSKGVLRCEEKMRELEGKCMDALSILGYLMCLPLKITVFCQVVKLLPGAIGSDCSSMNVVDPGFGDTYLSASAVIDDMDQGFKVKMEYQVVGDPEAIDYTPVEELRQATLHEVDKKITFVDYFFSFISYILTFTFLLIFKSAYTYNSQYLSDISFDNNYVTHYFRHIDARRRDQDKRTLLPLKKIEKKDVIFPGKMGLTSKEKGKLGKGTAKLLVRILISIIICYMDDLMYQVLDIISRNSRVEYHQEGEHIINIKVYGDGFMSALVATFLEKFNSKHTLNKVTTNHACLPKPSKTDVVIVAFIFATYILVWIFIYFEAFSLRMRRVIASFFYRKREKKRVLHMYNEMYRKRLGYLKHMRKTIRKQIKARELKKKVGVIVALQRQFPNLCGFLKVFKSAKEYCIVCGEPQGEGFYLCETPGCRTGYCEECWEDIKMRCYVCGQREEGDDQSTSEDESVTEDTTEDDDL